MKKRFYSVNGQMMGYEEGGVKKDFLTDHLGSITAEMDQTQTRTYDTRYSAYGRNNWSTGSNSGFGWVGSYGYRETGLFHMSHYVRARHYSYLKGAWSTVDPLWPDESAYGYVQAGALRFVDYFGLQRGGGVAPPPRTVPSDFPRGSGRSGGPGFGAPPPPGIRPGGKGGQVVNPPAPGGSPGPTDGESAMIGGLIDGNPISCLFVCAGGISPNPTPGAPPKVIVVPPGHGGRNCVAPVGTTVREADFLDFQDCAENNRRIHPRKNGLPGDGCDAAPCPRPPFCYSWVDDFVKECLMRRNRQLYCDRINPPGWSPKPEEHLKHLCLALDKLQGCSPQCYENHPNKVIIDIVKAKCKGVKR